jgi:hypothetical protein
LASILAAGVAISLIRAVSGHVDSAVRWLLLRPASARPTNTTAPPTAWVGVIAFERVRRCYFVEPMMGIEPAYSAWEAAFA